MAWKPSNNARPFPYNTEPLLKPCPQGGCSCLFLELVPRTFKENERKRTDHGMQNEKDTKENDRSRGIFRWFSLHFEVVYVRIRTIFWCLCTGTFYLCMGSF